MSSETINRCPACGGKNTVSLPVPHPDVSMISDGKILQMPLDKMSCDDCGYGFHTKPVDQEKLRIFYDDDYDLGQRDLAAEATRARQYADVIEDFLTLHTAIKPAKVVEFGCGLGSLLVELAKRLDTQEALGIEPSEQLTNAAKEKSNSVVSFRQSFAEDMEVSEADRFDLCLSVNVIEHTQSPQLFLEACKALTKTDGNILIVCPDGHFPNLELMFFDHISSFTVPALKFFSKRAGLSLVGHQTLTGPLAGFQMILLGQQGATKVDVCKTTGLTKARADYIQSIQTSSATMKKRVAGRRYAVFGVGEFADILATYCPDVIAGADAFVVDNCAQETFLGKPVLETAEFLRTPGSALIAAVNERSWQAVQKRFLDHGTDIYHPYMSK